MAKEFVDTGVGLRHGMDLTLLSEPGHITCTSLARLLSQRGFAIHFIAHWVWYES